VNRWIGNCLGAFVTLSTIAVVSAAARAAPAGAAAAPLQQVQLPYVMRDSLGNNWDVQQDGRIGDGSNIYDGGGKLFVGGDNNQWVSTQQQASYDPAANEVVLAPSQLEGLTITRRLCVNAQQNWCRWMEILENPGPTAIRTQMRVNFALAGQIANSRDLVDDKKTHKNVGVAVFDGNHSLAMIGAGRGARVVPRITYQQNTDQVDFSWDVEVPPKKKVVIVHFQVARANFTEAAAFWDGTRDKDLLADVPADLNRVVVNFPHPEKLVNDLEVLRGGLLDVVELRGGDQWRGTLKDASYKLDTFCGPLELPADQVVSMMTIGSFRPLQLFVTAEGEVFGGTLAADSIKLQLTSGQITSIPLHSVTRLGYRRRPGEPEEWRFDKPTAFLRDGQRIGVKMPAGDISVSTVYGPLLLKPQSIAALIFQGDEQPVHQVLLADGSRFCGVVTTESFDLKIRNPAIGTDGLSLARGPIGPSAGHDPIIAGVVSRSFSFPTQSLARLQFSADPEDAGEQTPTLDVTNGDRLVGALAGQLELETSFDTIRINGAEVRAIAHAQPDGVPPGASVTGAGAPSPTEVQVTLWDDATLSGRLKGDAVGFTLKSGITLKVPAALIEQYSQPQPRPSQEVLDRIKSIVAELADPDWKHRDRAADQLRGLGPPIAPVLKDLKVSQPPEAQKQIDAILKGFEDSRRSRERQLTHPSPQPADVLVAPAPPPVNGPQDQ
jgi:hypothetical protein